MIQLVVREVFSIIGRGYVHRCEVLQAGDLKSGSPVYTNETRHRNLYIQDIEHFRSDYLRKGFKQGASLGVLFKGNEKLEVGTILNGGNTLGPL